MKSPLVILGIYARYMYICYDYKKNEGQICKESVCIELYLQNDIYKINNPQHYKKKGNKLEDIGLSSLFSSLFSFLCSRNASPFWFKI